MLESAPELEAVEQWFSAHPLEKIGKISKQMYLDEENCARNWGQEIAGE